MEPVAAPRTFSNRYEVTHLIARGGMAQVYRALDLRLGRHVALKVLFPELSVDRTFVERFRREAQAAANLSNPNVVAVYDWGEDDAHLLHRDGADHGDLARDRAAHRAHDPGDARRLDRGPGGRRPLLRAPPRRRAPRHQAGQRHADRRRPGEGHRLRHRPGGEHRGGPDDGGLGHGHGRLLLARAGRRRGRRRPQRRVLARHRALRDADRPHAVRGGLTGRGRVDARAQHAAAAARPQPRGPRRHRGDHAAGARQGPRGPLPDRRGVPPGPAAVHLGSAGARRERDRGRRRRGDLGPRGRKHDRRAPPEGLDRRRARRGAARHRVDRGDPDP